MVTEWQPTSMSSQSGSPRFRVFKQEAPGKLDSFYYGGQAVIEGVMMRGRKHLAIAVRRTNDQITTVTRRLPTVYTGRLRQIPLVRGVVVLAETLVLGIQGLLYSADVFTEKEQVQGKWAMLWGAVVVGAAMGVVLFLAIPLAITQVIDPYIGSDLVSNLVDGVIRLVIVIAYIGAIGLIPPIRRVFSYHGAEHKVVNAYEDGAGMEVKEVRSYSTAHPRCGTGFVLIVLVVAIVAFIFLGRPPMYLRFLWRLLLLPVIAAVSYELMRLGAEHVKNGIVRTLLSPGLALQALTTRQPDDRQLEVSISALKAAIDADALDAEAAETGNTA
jgi:uncharacterized protein YqhQ